MKVIAAELRKNLNHTQQSWAQEMGWGISSAVRYEHGAKPGVKALTQMLDAAVKHDQDAIAAELRVYLNEELGPAFPLLEPAPKHEVHRRRRESAEDRERWTEINAVIYKIVGIAQRLTQEGRPEGKELLELVMGRLGPLTFKAHAASLGIADWKKGE